jgi:hypothetical protein
MVHINENKGQFNSSPGEKTLYWLDYGYNRLQNPRDMWKVLRIVNMAGRNIILNLLI